jgi:hypothetical protein
MSQEDSQYQSSEAIKTLGTRPLGSLSNFVVRELPAVVGGVKKNGQGNVLSQLAEDLTDNVQEFNIPALDGQDLSIARLDAIFLEQAIAHSGGKPGPSLSSLVTELIDRSGRMPGLTYEDLIFTNPREDLRLFHDGEVGESEKQFYLGHMQIEDHLLTAIDMLFKAQATLSGNKDSAHDVKSRLEAAANKISAAAGEMDFFINKMPREHFIEIARFHDPHDFREGARGAGGQFSASFPIIDLLVSGKRVPEKIRNNWQSTLEFMPQIHADNVLRALDLAATDKSILDLVEKSTSVAGPLSKIDTGLRGFRARHYRAVISHLPEVSQGEEGMMSGDEATDDFLKQRIAIKHK